MRNAIDPDILGTKQRPWNTSVFVQPKEENTQQTLFNGRKGLRDEAI